MALAPDERIPSLEKGSVAIVCDASSFTWARDDKVHFSVSYGITGAQLLVPANANLASPESLSGERIGALAGTTNALAIAKAQPAAQLVFMDDREDGYRALERGSIDAFADDSILLYAWLQRRGSSAAANFRVTGRTYSKEGIACMLPRRRFSLWWRCQSGTDSLHERLSRRPARTAGDLRPLVRNPEPNPDDPGHAPPVHGDHAADGGFQGRSTTSHSVGLTMATRGFRRLAGPLSLKR